MEEHTKAVGEICKIKHGLWYDSSSITWKYKKLKSCVR